jgi:hypothetical protein
MGVDVGEIGPQKNSEESKLLELYSRLFIVLS